MQLTFESDRKKDSLVSATSDRTSVAYDANCREHLGSESVRVPSPYMGLWVPHSLTHLAAWWCPNVPTYRSMNGSTIRLYLWIVSAISNIEGVNG
jgi:hypothetical protein